MDEQFDNSLKNHIRDVFENFEDPAADEGWLLLRKKFPVKDKKRPATWLWWASAAAVLILALGIGTWVKNQKNDKEKPISYKPSKHYPIKKNNLPDNTVADHKTGQYSTQKEALSVKAVLSNEKTTDNTQIAKAYKGHNNNTPISVIKEQDEPTLLNNKDETIVTEKQRQAITENKEIASIAAVPATDSAVKAPSKPVIAQRPEKPLLYTGSHTIKDEQPNKPAQVDEKRVKFSVYAATYFNYAKGSENQLNMGVGFTSDIKLSKNLKLSTGVAIAQNTLNYNNQSPTPAIQQQALNYAVKSSAMSVNNFGYTSTTPVLKNYNALLVGLDVPINLKYEFNPQKSRSYVAVGLSSGTFINESYTYNYNTLGGASSSAIPQSKAQTSNNSFDDFYFAKTLNVSFGIGYPLGKKNHLIIEPFLKYPLSGLGSQQLYFGAGGLNLKFDFQSSKK